MNRLVEWIDRLKLVEALIFLGTVWFGAVWFGNRFGGNLGIAVAVASAVLLLTPYYWWRRRGVFRNRR